MVHTERSARERSGDRIGVVGIGHVGAAVAVGFASLGHHVTAVDTDGELIDSLSSQRRASMTDATATELLADLSVAGRLRFDTDLAALADAAVVCICVPTPNRADANVDLTAVTGCVDRLEPVLAAGSVIAIKSTVPVGTTASIQDRLRRRDLHVVANPEFLTAARATHDFLHPDRIVIGSDHPDSAQRVARLYESIDAPVLATDSRSAELIKYATNAFLAVKVSFANEIADLAATVGADTAAVLGGLSADHRIGSGHLRPGLGWGGACLPKDTDAFTRFAERAGTPLAITEAAVSSNMHHIDRIAQQIDHATRPESTIAVWGVPTTVGGCIDVASPATRIIRQLAALGHTIQAYGSTVDDTRLGAGIDTVRTPEEACEGAEVLAILTPMLEYDTIDAAALDVTVAYDIRQADLD